MSDECLHWMKKYSMLTGRVVAVTISATTFAQERFLGDLVSAFENSDSLAIKVYCRRGERVVVSCLGNELLGDDDLSEDYGSE